MATDILFNPFGGIGPSGDLETVLTAGNTTGANDIVVSDAQQVRWSDVGVGRSPGFLKVTDAGSGLGNLFANRVYLNATSGTAGAYIDGSTASSNQLNFRRSDDSAALELNAGGFRHASLGFDLSNVGLRLGSSLAVTWSAVATFGSPDVGLARVVAGTVKVTDGVGTAGNTAKLRIGGADLAYSGGRLNVYNGGTTTHWQLAIGKSNFGVVDTALFVANASGGVGSGSRFSWSIPGLTHSAFDALQVSSGEGEFRFNVVISTSMTEVARINGSGLDLGSRQVLLGGSLGSADVQLSRPAARVLRLYGVTDGAALELDEASVSPGTPGASKARLRLKDNGGGKMQLVVEFPSGGDQVLATEP
jgi:hypothetical protein